MKQITKEQLVDIIQSIPDEVEVTLQFNGELKMKKTNNPYKDLNIQKNQIFKGIAGFDYTKEMNKQLILEGKEPTFESKSRAWGTLLEGGKLVEHKGNYYLQLKIDETFNTEYFYLDSDGNKVEVNKEDLAEFMPSKKSINDEEKAVPKLILRDIKFDNIKSIKINEEEYQLQQTARSTNG